MATPEDRLADLGIDLSVAPAAAAAYVPYAFTGNHLYTSGQVAMDRGELIATGKLGDALDVEAGQQAARRCAINTLAQYKAALGDLGRIERIVKVTVFVASEPDFTQQHLVANGASELFADVLGDAGPHARSAVGVRTLPLDSPVEIETIVEVSA